MKKFVSLLLIISFIVLSLNLIAKERRGAELVIQKKDGHQISGELIAFITDYPVVERIII